MGAMRFTRRQVLAAAAAAPFVAGNVARAADGGFTSPAAEASSTNPADLTLVELLAGIPIGLKDMTYTKEVPTTGSSKAMEDYIPDCDATVWTRLEQAGMVLLGKRRC